MNRLARARILQKMKNSSSEYNTPTSTAPIEEVVKLVDVDVDIEVEAQVIDNVIKEIIEPESLTPSLEIEEPAKEVEVEVVDSSYKKKTSALKGKMT